MSWSDITVSAVNQAIDEFNQLKRKAFLKKYKFGPARGYLIEKDGRTYDSKAIAGAAHGYLPGQQPLTAKDFSGGEATVKKKLEELGFTPRAALRSVVALRSHQRSRASWRITEFAFRLQAFINLFLQILARQKLR
jgi:hypothetical protein